MLSNSTKPSQSLLPALISSVAGTTFVWYDYYLFGSLATVISPHFFPRSLAGLTSTGYAYTFVLALVMRPAGGLFVAWYADKRGRRSALASSLFLAGLSTFLIGILPEVRVIGIVAPIALLALRTIQSLAFGGAQVVAIVYVFELAPRDRRGLCTSFLQIAPAAGLALSLAVIVVTRRALGNKLFFASGWRIPLLVSLLLAGLSIYIRMRMSESPCFRETARMEESLTQRTADPGRGTSRILIIKLLFGIVAGQASLFYLSQFYAGFHLQNVLKIETWTAAMIVCGANLLGIPFFVLFGAMSDRFGRKKIILASCLLGALICLPVYSLMQRAAGTQVTRIAPGINPVTGVFGPHPETGVSNRFEPMGGPARPNVPLLMAIVFLPVLFSAAVAGPLPAYLAQNFRPERRCISVAGTYVGHNIFGGLLPLISLPLLVSTGNIHAALYVAMFIAFGSFIIGVTCLRHSGIGWDGAHGPT